MFVVDHPERLLKEEGVECLTPDLHPEIIADINVSPSLSKWKRELIEGARVQYELAVLRQRKITEAADQLELCHMDGLGKRICSLDTELAFRLEGMFGRRWWMKKEILHEVLKDNPWLEIRSSPVRPSFLVDGRRDEKTEVRGQRSEDRGQRSEVGGQRADAGRAGDGLRSIPSHGTPARSSSVGPEVGGVTSEVRGRRSEVR